MVDYPSTIRRLSHAKGRIVIGSFHEDSYTPTVHVESGLNSHEPQLTSAEAIHA